MHNTCNGVSASASGMLDNTSTTKASQSPPCARDITSFCPCISCLVVTMTGASVCLILRDPWLSAAALQAALLVCGVL